MTSKYAPTFLLAHNEAAMPGTHFILHTKLPMGLFVVDRNGRDLNFDVYEWYGPEPSATIMTNLRNRMHDWYIGNVLSNKNLYK